MSLFKYVSTLSQASVVLHPPQPRTPQKKLQKCHWFCLVKKVLFKKCNNCIQQAAYPWQPLESLLTHVNKWQLSLMHSLSRLHSPKHFLLTHLLSLQYCVSGQSIFLSSSSHAPSRIRSICSQWNSVHFFDLQYLSRKQRSPDARPSLHFPTGFGKSWSQYSVGPQFELLKHIPPK